MKTLEQDYLELCQMASPSGMGSVQFQECRRFFMAGAWATFNKLVGPELCSQPDEVGERMLTAIRDECEQFARDVAAGKK